MRAIKRYRNRILLLGFAALGYLWFFILERLIRTPTWMMYIPLDDYIPFIPAFIIFYTAWYLYLLIPAFLLFWTDEEEFLVYGTFAVGALWVACLIYTIWPNGIALRPDLEGAPGIFHALIRFLYRIDTPTNSAPSLHVAQSIAAHIAITRRCRKRNTARWIPAASATLCALIILSTVLIKQHSVVDIFYGLLLAAVMWTVTYGRIAVRERKGRHKMAHSR